MAKNSSFDKSSLTKEERTFFENRKLKDKFFFGKFKETKSGYQISDIRRSDFSKIKYKPKGAKVFVIETEGFFDEISWVQSHTDIRHLYLFALQFHFDWSQSISDIDRQLYAK